MWPEPSPFIFDNPLPPERVIGRHQEISALVSWAKAGRSVAVVAPRRFGKTSLFAKLAAEARDLVVVVVDLYDTASLADLVIRLERAWAGQVPPRWRQRVAERLAGVQIGVQILGSGFSVRLAQRPDADPLPALHALLDMPAAMPKRCVVVLDEFQSLAAVPQAEGIIRSHAQHQRDEASYIFAGSEPHMVSAAFVGRGRPFYGQVEVLRLGRIPADETLGYLAAQFDATGRSLGTCGAGLVEASELHPQRTMLLAELLWRRTAPGSTAAQADLAGALRASIDAVEGEALALLDGLSRGEVKALRVIAEHGTPLSAAGNRSLGLAKATAASAGKALEARGIVERLADGTWRTVDPLLGTWLRERYRTVP